jgi:hypothetical protein
MSFLRLIFFDELDESSVRDIFVEYGFEWKVDSSASLKEGVSDYYLDSDWSVGDSGFYEWDISLINELTQKKMVMVLYIEIQGSNAISDTFAGCINKLLHHFGGRYINDKQGIGGVGKIDSDYVISPYDDC